MLFHAVLCNFKDDVSKERIEEIMSLSRKLTQIPGVKNLLAGETIKPDGDYKYAITMHFDDEAALEAYRVHPDHERFRDVDFFPFLKDKIGLDYVD